MTLLFLSTAFPQPADPRRAPYNELLCRALALQHRVGVVVPVRWIDRLAAGRRNGRRAVAAPYAIEFPTYFYPPATARAYHAPLMERSVRSAVERVASRIGRPDAVISYWTYPDGAAAASIGRRMDAPVVMIVGGSDVLVLARRMSHRRLIAGTLEKAAAVVAVSGSIAAAVVALGVPEHRVHVVPRGVDSSVFRSQARQEVRERLGLAADERILLYAGRLTHVKGVDVLLDSTRLLTTRGVEFSLVVAGDGPLRTAVAHLANASPPGRVKLLGDITHETLADWYGAADVVVVPSRSEGIPNVCYEAAACGIPFVASAVGGIPSIAREGIDRLVTPGHAAELAAAIEEVLACAPPTPAHVVWTWAESAHRVAALAERSGLERQHRDRAGLGVHGG